MNSTTDAPSFDQASGLRELFGSLDQATDAPTAAPETSQKLPAVDALVCPSRPALSLPLAQACTRWLTEQQSRHAWVDELDFEARENWPLPRPVRFDLGQSLANHVPLASALLPLDDPLAWYASARRLPSAMPAQGLAQRLAQSGLAFDQVLVCVNPHTMRPWNSYGPQIKPVILCEATPEATALTRAWLHSQAATGGLDLQAARWVVLGNPLQPTSFEQTRTTISQHWRALAGRAPSFAADAQLVPDEALQTLAAHWLTLAPALFGPNRPA
jgi:hypothetical protein